jgi:hypothetical protein
LASPSNSRRDQILNWLRHQILNWLRHQIPELRSTKFSLTSRYHDFKMLRLECTSNFELASPSNSRRDQILNWLRHQIPELRSTKFS